MTKNNFITNAGSKDLKNRIIELTTRSLELRFLVGFFYFSGIRELYEGLKANPTVNVKVLVGLNVDAGSHGLIEYGEKRNQTNDEAAYDYFSSLKIALNTEDFDNQEFYTQINYFIELVNSGRLIIRKTLEPNHSKLYLFGLDETQIGTRELFITGSSNLTKAGLRTQNEFNVEISDYGYSDAASYFESLWATSVKITEFEDLKIKLITTLSEETLVKSISPFEAYLLVMKTYLDSFAQEDLGTNISELLLRNGYTPYKYQLDAVQQATGIIEKNNGVIIADVVGLGKTVIACAVAKHMKKRGIVICPPGLVGDRDRSTGWRKYIEEFGLYDWEVRSLGDLEGALAFVNQAKDFEMVIVDEAHRFRNQDTEAYEQLKNICRGRQVLLLTATPFNNSPEDILSLLKLFVTPKNSAISIENNLVDQFTYFRGVFERLGFIKKNWNSNDSQKRIKAENYYRGLFGGDKIELALVSERQKFLASQIRNVIEPVTIRRNRLDLLNNPFYKDEIGSLSKVSDPQEWFYSLTGEQLDFYTNVIDSYFADPADGGRFKGAIYRPFHYEKNKLNQLGEIDNRQFVQQQNLFDFMRRLLVKRFESSFGSFQQSIKNFLQLTTRNYEFIKSHGEYILDRSLMEKIYDLDADEIEDYLLEYEQQIIKGERPKNHRRYKVDEFERKEDFLADIESDIALFNEILGKLSELDLVIRDPKTQCLIENIEKVISKKPLSGEPVRKVLIFSEYVDTIKYLQPALEAKFEGKLITVSGDLTKAKLKEINEDFDASSTIQNNDLLILLTSDKMSEGFNLNRAGCVINYDIPWNPVKVIQRLGRINRISKKVFDELQIVNFFPTEIGANLVKSREIAANKMFLIHSTLGEDSKIFDVDEVPQEAELFKRINVNPETLEAESFYTKVLREFYELQTLYPEVVESLPSIPPRVKVAKKGERDELFVFFRKNRLYVYSSVIQDGEAIPSARSIEDVYERLKCSVDEAPMPWNHVDFWRNYEAIANYKEFRKVIINEQSLEQRALNKIDFLLKENVKLNLEQRNFLQVLKRDVINFGTLPDYTLRRIGNISDDLKDLQIIFEVLGADYLEREITRNKAFEREVIIAIEEKANV